jgi:hypothetical protein
MKTYYCVMSEFYSDGTIKAAMISRERREKPRDSFRHVFKMHAYHDWFASLKEAEAFLAEVKAA